MGTELAQRPKWQIDQTLDRLIGVDVRVAAESFSPSGWNRKGPLGLIPVREFVLPNNRAAADLPVYFEGRLVQFIRRIGVVYVRLGPPSVSEQSVDGMVYFRGRTAAILRAPAFVRWAFPFQVEKLPSEPCNYWRDLHFPRVQFEFPF
jgi:hypothetical protein